MFCESRPDSRQKTTDIFMNGSTDISPTTTVSLKLTPEESKIVVLTLLNLQNSTFRFSLLASPRRAKKEKGEKQPSQRNNRKVVWCRANILWSKNTTILPLYHHTNDVTMQQFTVQQPTQQQPTVQQPTIQQPTVQQPFIQQPSDQASCKRHFPFS